MSAIRKAGILVWPSLGVMEFMGAKDALGKSADLSIGLENTMAYSSDAENQEIDGKMLKSMSKVSLDIVGDAIVMQKVGCACMLDLLIVIHFGTLRVFKGPDDLIGYGYYGVQLHWACLGATCKVGLRGLNLFVLALVLAFVGFSGGLLIFPLCFVFGR